jgi:[ribosomal protein S18]-alanine N-acetyltransferase
LSPSWVVRPGHPDDAVALAQIDRLGSSRPWSEAQIRAACSAVQGMERVLLIERGGVVAGFAVFQIVVDEGSIHNIVIHPLYQRQGLGRKLLGGVIDALVAAGAQRCLLDVRESNAAARALYLEQGFELDGRRENYYSGAQGREAALLMSRQLRGSADECS